MKFEEFKSGKLDHLHLTHDSESVNQSLILTSSSFIFSLPQKSPDLQYTEIVERVFIPFITDSNIRFPDFSDLTHPLIDAINQVTSSGDVIASINLQSLDPIWFLSDDVIAKSSI